MTTRREPMKSTGQVAGGQHMKRLPLHVVEEIRRKALKAKAAARKK